MPRNNKKGLKILCLTRQSLYRVSGETLASSSSRSMMKIDWIAIKRERERDSRGKSYKSEKISLIYWDWNRCWSLPSGSKSSSIELRALSESVCSQYDLSYAMRDGIDSKAERRVRMEMRTRCNEGSFPFWIIWITNLNGRRRRTSDRTMSILMKNFLFPINTFPITTDDFSIESRSSISDSHRTFVDCFNATPPASWIFLFSPV